MAYPFLLQSFLAVRFCGVFVVADIKLSDFKKSLDQSFGPFTIEFEHDGEEHVLKIRSYVTASPSEQIHFTKLFGAVGGVVTGNRVDEDLELLTGKTVEELNALSEEEISEAIMQGSIDGLRKAMRSLATSKRLFDLFAKQVDDTIVAWFAIVGQYCQKYGMFGVDGDDEGNAGN